MTAPLFTLLVATVSAVAVAARRRRRLRLPAQALIVSPRRSTDVSESGAVRSVQSAEVTIRSDAVDRLWNSTNLERLARTYWRFLSRVTLGLIRVMYGENERSIVLVARPLTLLRFDAPQYELECNHGKVSWLIRDGLLVARAGRKSGYLAIDVRRCPPGEDGFTKILIELEVANFYPAIAAGYGMRVYTATQSTIHVLVGHAFLRSLARLDLAVSRVGRFERRRTPRGSKTRGWFR